MQSIRFLVGAADLLEKALGRSDFEMLAVRTFALVAEAGGRPIPQGTIRDRLNVSESTVSRNIAILSAGNPIRGGAQLIESSEDPLYRRRKLVKLTASGRSLAESLESLYINISTGA